MWRWGTPGRLGNLLIWVKNKQRLHAMLQPSYPWVLFFLMVATCNVTAELSLGAFFEWSLSTET